MRLPMAAGVSPSMRVTLIGRQSPSMSVSNSDSDASAPTALMKRALSTR